MSQFQASGFGQIPPVGGLLRDDAVRAFELGTVISDTQGNSYRYVKASTALTVGMAVSTTPKAAWDTTIVMDGASAVGDLFLHVDTVATDMTRNQYRGYYLSQATAAGLGRGMKIKSHIAITAAGDEGDIYLETPCPEIVADGGVLLIYNPYLVVPIALGTGLIMGVAIGTITVNQYGFIQVGGHCPAVAVGGTTAAAIVIDEPLVAPATIATDQAAGSLQGIAGSTEADIMEGLASPLRSLQAVGANTAGFVEAFIHGLV